jgi:hypothetical protein
MRYKLLFTFLIVILSACSFNIQVVTPEALADTAISVTLANTETPEIQIKTPSESPTPLPTFTDVPQVSTPLPVSGNASPIHFAPGGTYVDVIDSIAGGSIKPIPSPP